MVRIPPSAILVALVLLPAMAGAQVRELTLDQAVKMGLEHSPDLRMNRMDIEKAEADKTAAIFGFLPRVTLDAGIQYWDQATKVQFLDPNAIPPELLALLGEGGTALTAPIETQRRTTSATNLQVVLPITPQYSLAYLYKLQEAGLDVARLQEQVQRDTQRFRIAESFFRLKSALKMTEVAQMGLEQVLAHLKTARSFFDAGLVGKDDVLRAETALARVQDQLNQAQSGAALARAALNVQIGLGTDEPTVPVGDYPDPPPALSVSEEQAVDRALDKRPEAAQMGKRIEMANAGWHAQVGQLIPTIAGVFRYSHTTGSKFQREDTWLIGASLQWNFWDLGGQWFKLQSVGADRRKAQEAMGLVRDGILLDVKKAWLDLKAARLSIETNRKAIESAEENLRVVTKKYEAATATSVEVLDAQSALTQARAGYQVATYQYYTAYANLQRATAGAI